MAEIYVPGAIDIMGSANQMMQFRNSQQAQQANALQMQYAAEDRARAEQGRRAAASNALAERAALSKALENSVVGYAGPEQPNLGNAQKDLAMQGRFGAATAISNVQEQFAKQKEQEAKAAGQGLTNVKTGVETEEKRADVTKKAIEIQRQSFDYAQDLPTLKALITASYTPGHPLSEFHAINGVTLDQALKSIDDLAAQGKTFEQIREQMSQGASKAADNIAARGLVTAQTDKVKGEAGGGGSGGTENERNRQLFAKAMQDPNYLATAEYAALYNMSFGRKMVEVQDPNGPPGQMVNRIIDVPAPEGFPRPTYGQQPNTLAPATAAAQPTNALAMAGRYGSGTPAPTAQAPNLGVDMRTGEGMVTKQPAVSGEREKQAITLETAAAGKPKVTDTIQKMMDTFEEYNKLGGMVSDEKSFRENVVPFLSSGMFKDAMPLANPKAATQKQVLDSLVETAVKQIAAAAGLTARQMDSNADVQRLRAMVADPEKNITIEAAREILSNIDATYGTGTAKRTAPATATSDKIARSVDIEHTAKQNNMSLADTKARLRSMGYKIEGE
jgi:hypothetical protein